MKWLALIFASSTASPPPCSLNGILDAGRCRCDAPWTGESCAVLDFEPQPDDYVPAYGYSPNVTSWGGNAIQADGLYHLFVSEIPGGLANWGDQSQIVHAVAEDPMGTFRKVATPFPHQAHNAAPVQAPATHSACPHCWYVFHIGKSNSTSGFAHRAASPDGPWEPVPAPSFYCNNPAPAFARNGTLVVVCNSLNVYQAGEDPMDSTTWTHLSDIDVSSWTDGTYLKNEDAYIWQSPRGWHLLSHRYDYRNGFPLNPNATGTVLVSGHAFSTDLLTWHLSSEPPFGNTVTFASGHQQHFATLERPHLILNPDGVPTHAVHAASPIWDQYGAPCNVCDSRPGSEHSCVVCKTTKGFDWTYTMVRKLRVDTRLRVVV